MFSFLAFLTGVLSTVTVSQNGQLAAFYGDYTAAALVHFVGLCTVLVLRLAMRKRMPAKEHAPLWMFMGGVVGVGTLVFTTMAYGGVDVTAIVGLCLLGQTLTSVVVDHFGLFGAPRRAFAPFQLCGLAAVAAGAAVMVLPLTGANAAAVLFATLSGVTIVLARTLNARLSAKQGAMRSTVMNYVTGLGCTVLLALLVGRSEPMFANFQMSGNWFMYMGGMVGVCLIMLLNITVGKVSAVAFTLLQCIGQVATGLLLDTISTGMFSWRSAIGGVLVAVGLCINTLLERRRTNMAA